MNELLEHLDEAETKAWDSLARYKFQMFGYWAAIWVHLNKIGRFKRPNPWADLVRAAKGRNLKIAETQAADLRDDDCPQAAQHRR